MCRRAAEGAIDELGKLGGAVGIVETVERSASNIVEALEELHVLNGELSQGAEGEAKLAGDRLSGAIDELHLLYRAVRAFYAGKGACENGKFEYASTFCLFAQQIVGELKGDAAPSIFEDEAEAFMELRFAGNLREDVELLSCSVKAEALLAKSEARKGEKGEEMARYLSEDVKQRVEFDARGRYRVTPIPVAMKTTTCKPLFFDMVDERVTYPNLEARSRVAEKKGWFSGWWWSVCWNKEGSEEWSGVEWS